MPGPRSPVRESLRRAESESLALSLSKGRSSLLGDKPFSDPEFQAYYMHLMDSGASTLISQSVSQFLPI